MSTQMWTFLLAALLVIAALVGASGWMHAYRQQQRADQWFQRVVESEQTISALRHELAVAESAAALAICIAPLPASDAHISLRRIPTHGQITHQLFNGEFSDSSV